MIDDLTTQNKTTLSVSLLTLMRQQGLPCDSDDTTGAQAPDKL